jgi:thioredoxin-like negative regulator of GroEL
MHFGVHGIPRLYLVGKDGKLISDKVRGRDLEKKVEKALAAKYEPEVQEADEVEQEAETELAEADKLRDAGKLEQALGKYDQIGLEYIGRPVAQSANERARALRESPEYVKTNGADALTAKPSEKASESAKAKPKMSAEDVKRAERWLTLARAAAKNKKLEDARGYYQRIIDTYADSQQATLAQKELEALK